MGTEHSAPNISSAEVLQGVVVRNCQRAEGGRAPWESEGSSESDLPSLPKGTGCVERVEGGQCPEQEPLNTQEKQKDVETSLLSLILNLQENMLALSF